MKIDFQFKGIKYGLDFDDYLSQQIHGVDIKIYSEKAMTIGLLRIISDEKIIFMDYDEKYISKDAQEYCNRFIKNLVFA